MTQIEKPASRVSRAGLSVVHVSGGTRTKVPEAPSKLKSPAPLFNPRTRDDALHTANELNAAALRCRAAAREHPGSTGLTLDRLAGHYAGMAADWFGRADTLPSLGGLAH